MKKYCKFLLGKSCSTCTETPRYRASTSIINKTDVQDNSVVCAFETQNILRIKNGGIIKHDMEKYLLNGFLFLFSLCVKNSPLKTAPRRNYQPASYSE